MPFNPAVTDKTADYIFEGAQLQSGLDERERLRQQQQLGEAMEQFGQLAKTFKEDAVKASVIDGKTEAFATIAKQAPELAGGMEFLNSILAEKNRDKRGAKLLVGMDMFEKNFAAKAAEDRIRMNAAMRAELEREQAAGNPTGQPFVVTDPVSKTRTSYIYTSPNSVAPIRGEQAAKPDALTNAMQAADQQTRADLEKDVTRLQGEVNAGNVKPGPDWLPGGLFGAPFADQLAGKQKELAEMAPQKFESPAAVKSALRAGTLTQDAALQILRSQFGFE